MTNDANNQLSSTTARIAPDGFVGIQLGRRQMEIYLLLLDETMNVAQMLAAQLRAIEIIAAHEKVAEMHGFSR